MNDSLIGKQLDEYRLEALLGQGGMARVYRALDTRLKRYVALKLIDAPFRQDNDYILRFEREAQAIAQLEHGHIVHLYRFGEQDGLLYMAMQYIEGANFDAILSQYEQDGEQMEAADASRIIRQVCLALDYAHSRGVIHRDVKPANVMLNKMGQAFVTDFGLALLTDLGTRGEVFGTPEYIAPEQAISSAGAIPQSDFYAVGVMLYRIFTGVLPFVGDDPLDVAMRHMTEPPHPPRELRPEINPRLEAVILKSLAKEAADRYPDGRALADALDDALRDFAPAPILLPPKSTIAERVSLDAALLPPLPANTPPLDSDEALTAPPLPAAWAEAPATEPVNAESGAGRRPLGALGWGIGGAAALFICFTLIVVAGLFHTRDRGNRLAEIELTQAAATPTLRLDQDAATTAPALTSAPELTTAAPTLTNSTPLPPVDADQTSGPFIWLPMIAADVTGGEEAAAEPSPPLVATPTPQPYRLLLATRSDDSLFVVNRSELPFPLAGLQLGAGEAAVMGHEWGVAELPVNGCVAVWKAQGNPRAPDAACDLVGERLTRSARQVFWRDGFDLFYNNQRVAHSCRRQVSDCSIELLP